MMDSESVEKSVPAREPLRQTRSSSGWFNRMTLRLSPDRLLVVLAALIFAAEACAMFLLDLLPALPAGWTALLDSVILLTILSPAYFCLYRPFWKERQRTEEENRRLSRQLIRAEETTRKALARDLHDEFGQVLTALQLGIETLKNSLPTDLEKPAALCTRLSRLTAQLGNHVRNVTAELRPTMLDSLGLIPTLRWHTRQFRQQHPGMRIEIDMAEEGARLAPEVEIALYRVCQEGLNNVAKHARARRVRIALHQTPARLSLTIEDDGVGFEDERWRDADTDHLGFGVLGMRERIADLGGRFIIASRPGEGTAVRVDLPLVPEERV